MKPPSVLKLLFTFQFGHLAGIQFCVPIVSNLSIWFKCGTPSPTRILPNRSKSNQIEPNRTSYLSKLLCKSFSLTELASRNANSSITSVIPCCTCCNATPGFTAKFNKQSKPRIENSPDMSKLSTSSACWSFMTYKSDLRTIVPPDLVPRLQSLGFPRGTAKQWLQAGWQIGEVPTCGRSPVKS